MRTILIALTGMILFTGCATFTDKQLSKRHEGIVDACYTVIEYAPQDKDARIQKYLDSKQEQGHITTNEKAIIIKCLIRTEKSERWSK